MELSNYYSFFSATAPETLRSSDQYLKYLPNGAGPAEIIGFCCARSGQHWPEQDPNGKSLPFFFPAMSSHTHSFAIRVIIA